MKTNILLSTIILLVAPILVSIANRVDSLKRKLHVARGAERVDVTFELAYELIDSNNSQARHFAIEGFRAAATLKDSLRMVKMGRLLASALRRLDRLDSSIVIYRQIIPIAERNNFTDELKILYNSCGVTHTFYGQYGKALHYHLLALKLNRKTNDVKLEAVALNNIGLIYYKLQNSRKAIRYFTQCIEQSLRLQEQLFAQRALLNMALSYTALNKTDSAKHTVLRALQLCGSNCDARVLMESSFAMAIVDLQEKNFSNAFLNFKKSLGYATLLNDSRYQVDNLVYLARISNGNKKPLEALAYLTDCEKILAENRGFFAEAIKCYLEFILSYRQIGNHQMVINYQDKYISLKDSLFNENTISSLMEQEAEYLETENLARIQLQGQVLVLKQKIIDRQYLLNGFLFSTLALGILLVLTLNRSLRKEKQQKEQLESRVKERTQELAATCKELYRLNEEKNLTIRKIKNDFISHFRTIKGFSSIVLFQSDLAEVEKFINRLKSTSEQLNEMLQKIESDSPSKSVHA